MNTNIMRASRRVRLASSADRFLSLLFYSCLFVSIRGLKILADHRTTRFHSSLGFLKFTNRPTFNPVIFR